MKKNRMQNIMAALTNGAAVKMAALRNGAAVKMAALRMGAAVKAVALMTGAVTAVGLVACSSEDNIADNTVKPAASQAPVYQVSIPATLGGDGAQTRAVEFDGGGTTITTKFVSTDKVYVYNVTTGANATAFDFAEATGVTMTTTTTATDVSDALAAPGYKVTRSARSESDGNAYESTGKLPSTATAEAIVAYIGTAQTGGSGDATCTPGIVGAYKKGP